MRSAYEVLPKLSKVMEMSVHDVAGAEASILGWDIACSLIYKQ